MSVQKPLELILARNLLSSISTPAFLVGEAGTLLFYNEAASTLVGRRFEETGEMEAEHWTQEFGPLAQDGEPIPYDEISLTIALRRGGPAHDKFRIRHVGGNEHDVAVSAIPIVGPGGAAGAIVFFWPVSTVEDGEG